ncbi:MAPEG family protein [Marinibaculum pumilum]|uniref:MAPEG family protein n=1 Tax=Marinibaculum pumilum TaxID=1766165 RepID=A0ABV7KX10_9PROT
MNALTIELQVLGWSGLLAAVQLALMAVPANMQLGPRYTGSARDEQRQLTGVAGRLERAFRNQLEGLVMYAPAAIVVTAAGASGPFTEGCAIAYLAARIVYIPLYGFGVRWWRSVVWAVGFLATILMLIAGLLQGAGG